MKTFMNILLIAGLTAGVFNNAEAQRNRSSGSSSGRVSSSRSNVSPGRSFSGNTAIRSNSFSTYQRGTTTPSSFRGYNSRTFQQRNTATSNVGNRRNYNAVASSGIASNRISSSYRGGGNVYRNSYYRGGYSNSYYRGGGYMHGARYTFLPRNSISLYYGGYPYYYFGGLFYGYYDGFYQPLFPPIGIRVGFLPFGYSTFYLGGYPYYYYNGIYYQQYDNNDYEVVDPPMGASVYSLPEGAKSVLVNGEQLYELNGTYYKEDRDSKGQTIYTVVGKNGEINNTDNSGGLNPPPADNNVMSSPNNELGNPPAGGNDNNVNTPPASSALQMGDITNQLPQGSKLVTINGEQMYVTPDNTYLKAETSDGSVQYKVVGK